jgi:hypothetical protein
LVDGEREYHRLGRIALGAIVDRTNVLPAIVNL